MTLTTKAEIDEMLANVVSISLDRDEREALNRIISLGCATLCADALYLYKRDCNTQADHDMATIDTVRAIQARITFS